MHFLIPFLALGAQLVGALEFSAPAANSTLTRGSTFDLSWSSVDTDPTSFSVYLVNFVNWPPFYTPVKYNVETASGVTQVRVPCELDTGYGYQFNAINGTNLYVIYAQTPKFSINGAACKDPVTAASCPASTVTVTVSRNSSLVTGTAPAPTTTYAGSCPKTIGWKGGYGNAVTLTSVPAAGQPLITKAPAATGWNDWDATLFTTTIYRTHVVCPCDK